MHLSGVGRWHIFSFSTKNTKKNLTCTRTSGKNCDYSINNCTITKCGTLFTNSFPLHSMKLVFRYSMISSRRIPSHYTEINSFPRRKTVDFCSNGSSTYSQLSPISLWEKEVSFVKKTPWNTHIVKSIVKPNRTEKINLFNHKKTMYSSNKTPYSKEILSRTFLTTSL